MKFRKSIFVVQTKLNWLKRTKEINWFDKGILTSAELLITCKRRVEKNQKDMADVWKGWQKCSIIKECYSCWCVPAEAKKVKIEFPRIMKVQWIREHNIVDCCGHLSPELHGRVWPWSGVQTKNSKGMDPAVKSKHVRLPEHLKKIIGTEN